MKFSKRIFKMAFIAGMLTSMIPSIAISAMTDYCSVPPFLTNTLPPNVLIVLDNSGSMNDAAYATTYNPAQFASGQYYGLFDPTKYYQYTNTKWEPVTGVTTAAPIPATGPAGAATITNPIASGNLMNWATMSRISVAKKLLIGGKASPRSPAGAVTVKLFGETTWGFLKSFDNTSTANLIAPFTGNYRYSVSSTANLSIVPVSAGTSTIYTSPNANVSIPAAWTLFPAASTAFQDVDDTISPTISNDGDATYIQAQGTASPAMFGYDYTGAKPGGTITVGVRVVAKRSSGTTTRRIQGVLRISGVDYAAGTTPGSGPGWANISSTYATYSFNWTTNPATGLAWQWSDIKDIGNPTGNLQAFGVQAYQAYASLYPRVTQVYLVVTVSTPSGGPYSIIIDQGMTPASGIIDNLSSDARFGLGYYNTSEGGHIAGVPQGEYVGFGAATNMITSISNLTPSTWTPLGETLYEMVRYIRQDTPFWAGDYLTGLNYDPYYYKYSTVAGSGLTDQYVPCAKSFILMLTDGESTQDTNIPGTSTLSPYAACSLTNIKACSGYGGLPNPRFGGTAIGTTYSSFGTDYLIDVAYWARSADARPGTCTTTPTLWQQCIPGTQNVVIYPVFMFGRGSTLLKDASIYGGFEDMSSPGFPNGDNMPGPDLREYLRDSNGDGSVTAADDPITYFEGDDGFALEASITNAIASIMQRSASGTAASMLSSSEGSGANLLQAVFYPQKPFVDGTTIAWTGEMQNLWYYIDPRLNNSSIREDYPGANVDKKLSLTGDYVLQFFFDNTDNKTKVRRYTDTNGDGSGDTYVDYIDFDDINSLWKAGSLLHSRNLSTSPRTIKTNLTGSLIDYSIANFTGVNTANKAYLQAVDDTEATNIINYIHGTDISGYRNRTAPLNGITGTWKLGDIISSTPRIQSSVPLNKYNLTPPSGYGDTTYQKFIDSLTYKTRGMAYAGANDGMLHAFKLGILDFTSAGTSYKAQVCEDGNGDGKCGNAADSTANLGKEQWGFIPKNALPYLKYLADPNYCHLFYLDAPAYIFDASVNTPASYIGNYWDYTKTTTVDINNNIVPDTTSWRTILIGGMGLGGACRDSASACTNCVKAPMAGTTGFSSYFALDITDPSNPQLLWEFSDATLGFSTSGPAIIRIGDADKNGKWLAVFASGPTGPIDTTYKQFMGRSDQNMRLFVLDLKTGTLLRTITMDGIGGTPNIPNAFGGSLFNAIVDADRGGTIGAYNDDIIYLNYVKQSGVTWTDGGILRVMTKEDQNPANWTVSTVMDGIGPITTSISKLQDKTNHKLWVYFGTGRYFYKTTTIDDINSTRTLYAVQEQCYTSADTIDKNCAAAPLTTADLKNQTTTPSATLGAEKGWYINLDNPPATGYGAERVITNPSAAPNGVVFFTTFAPTADICGMGGNSYIWALKYDTGYSATALLQGKALLQVSTGEIKEVSLSSAFTDKDSRRTGAITGVPPQGQGFAGIMAPSAMRKIMHIRER